MTDYKLLYEITCRELQESQKAEQFYREGFNQYSKDIEIAKIAGLDPADGAEITLSRIAYDYKNKCEQIKQLEHDNYKLRMDYKLNNDTALYHINEAKTLSLQYIDLKTRYNKCNKQLNELQGLIMEWDNALESVDMKI